MAKGKHAAMGIGQKVTKISDENVDLYSLFNRSSGMQVYVGPGVPKERAEEMAVMLVDVPEVRLVQYANGERVSV
jgi:hypothetical protein